MDTPPIKSSNIQLVDNPHPGRKLPQFTATFAATLAAVATGTVLGWASPADPKIVGDNGEYGFPITVEENAWAGSLATLGAACACFPSGYLMDKIGRKKSLLLLALPFTLGWLLVIFAVNLMMLYFGRFIIGIAAGASCVTAPTYTSEIAQVEVRGTLGSFFQLMITIGILLTYVVGNYTTVMVLSIVCAIVPIVFVAVFIFMPETPYFLVSCDKIEEAKKALIQLRGSEYDSDLELKLIEAEVNETRNNPVPLLKAFSKRSSVLALVICVSLMFFQEFSGIDAVMFNTVTIFDSTGAHLDPGIATIIVGVLQTVATILSTMIVDKLGRRILLLLSSSVMVLCNIAIGVFFYLLDVDEPNQDLLDSISWLPSTALFLFIITFSLGFGPIPWLTAGEVSTPNIIAFVSSTAATANWIFAFITTRTFVDMQKGIGTAGAFWVFGGFTFLGILFVFFVVPETKGKSIDEIQRILNKKKKLSNDKS